MLLSQYPGMRSVLRSEIETILNEMTAAALVKLEDGLLREQASLSTHIHQPTAIYKMSLTALMYVTNTGSIHIERVFRAVGEQDPLRPLQRRCRQVL